MIDNDELTDLDMETTDIADEQRDDDSEDEVISEIDVVLSKPFEDNLFLFQYPIRPGTVDYRDTLHLGARYKPKSSMVEIDLMVDTKCTNYSRSKGEQMALNVDGKTVDPDKKYYQSNLVDKQVLVSTNATPDASSKRFGIAYFSDGKLQISPLKDIFQLRPSFSFMDKIDECINEGKQESSSDENDDNEGKAERVNVKFSSNSESDAHIQRRKESYEYMLEKQAEEPWIHMAFYLENESAAIKAKLNQKDLDENPVGGCGKDDVEEYVQSLLPETSVNIEKSLPDRFIEILKRCHTLCLGEVCNYLKCKIAELLPSVQEHGSHIVGDVWTLKSDNVFSNGTEENNSDKQRLCICRDLILWCFRTYGLADSQKLTQVTGLRHKDVCTILADIGTRVSDSVWRLSFIPTMHSFDSFPDVCQRQNALWNARMKIIKENLGLENFDALRCSEPSFDNDKMEVDNVDDVTPDVTLCDDNSAAFDKTHINTELQNFLRNYFNGRFWFTFNEVRSKLNLELFNSDPGHVLTSKISDQMIMSAAKELNYFHLNYKWPSPYQSDPLVMNFQISNDPNQYVMRKGLFIALSDAHNFRAKTFKDAVLMISQKEGFDVPSEAAMRNFLKETCDTFTTNRLCWYTLRDSLETK